MLKVTRFEVGQDGKVAVFAVQADAEEHINALLRRLVLGEGVAQAAAPAPSAPATAAKAAPAPQPAPAPAAAPVAAPKVAKPKPAPAPAPVAAPVVEEDEDGLPITDGGVKTDGDNDDDEGEIIPVSIMNAGKLREIILELQKTGVKTKAEIKAWCLRNQAAVPALQRISDLEERVDRAVGLLNIA